jgi:nucleoside-triphosphatase THEP1
MIWLISGEINSGKTSRIRNIFQQKEAGKAGGFISRKLYQDNTICGYEIVSLPDGPSQNLAWLGNKVNRDNKSDWDNEIDESPESFPYGQFIFSQAGFLWGELIIDRLLADKDITDIFIDEIGPLELQGRGFYSILLKALQSDKNLYIAVRTNCLKSFLEKFKIQKYKLLPV